MKRLMLFIAALSCLLFCGCGGNADAAVQMAKINEISFPEGAAREIELTEGKTEKGYIKVTGKDDFSPEKLVFVSTDESVASFVYDKTVLKNYVYYTIIAKSAGEAAVYVTSSDGTVKSGEIKITVSENPNVPDGEVRSFILNTGSKKYHTGNCSAARSITESNRELFSGTEKELAEMGYEPCKICGK